MRYAFEGLEVDTDRFELRHDDEVVHVEPQVFDVLVYLIERRDRVVPKAELLEAVWGDQFVSESALTTRIKQLRRAVGDSGRAQRIIRTAHGRGYRFVASLDEPPAGSRPAASSPARQQEIRFCQAPDGTGLAYATVGTGPPLVRAAHWVTHLDHDWGSPVWQHWLVGLSQHHTLVRYDERGCGLSDQDVEEQSLDAWVQDLETVVDACELERFALLGVSQGGAVAIDYAARHPDRVSHLVLYGAYAQGRLARATTEEQRREAALQIEMARHGWTGDDPAYRRYFTSSFIPDGPPELWESFADHLRRTTSAEGAVRLMTAWQRVDVRAAAEQVRAPTLVLHSRDEVRVPFEQARLLAAQIPTATLVPLDSRNHLLQADEPAWDRFLAEVDDFLR